jgi:hypothetical protein
LPTLHTPYEREMQALLHLPETVETAALLPVGYPLRDSEWNARDGGRMPQGISGQENRICQP